MDAAAEREVLAGRVIDVEAVGALAVLALVTPGRAVAGEDGVPAGMVTPSISMSSSG